MTKSFKRVNPGAIRVKQSKTGEEYLSIVLYTDLLPQADENGRILLTAFVNTYKQEEKDADYTIKVSKAFENGAQSSAQSSSGARAASSGRATSSQSWSGKRAAKGGMTKTKVSGNADFVEDTGSTEESDTDFGDDSI